jgi:tRNA G18 (ribose-2'-O)-methylase SpoU
MRGYFAIGAERISKAVNAGNLFRSAHAFGAAFVFTIAAEAGIERAPSDTSHTPEHVPWYRYGRVADFQLPGGCRLVGVEFLHEAEELPSFPHPQRAAYVFGPERGVLSAEVLARCDHVVRIPTRFCVNLAVAGAIVMYDRLIAHGRFAERPLSSTAKAEPVLPHRHGLSKRRSRA